MAVRGTKPKPTKLKVLTGNPGKRKLPKEPDLEPMESDVPAWLPEEGKAKWKTLKPELEKIGMLSSVDSPAFEMMLVHYALAKQAYLQLAADGILADGARGTEKKHPAQQILRDNSSAFKQYLTEFGMTPSSRTRLGTPKVNEVDEFEEFLKRGTKPS